MLIERVPGHRIGVIEFSRPEASKRKIADGLHMHPTHQLTLIYHRRNDELWATEDLVVEVVPSQFPGTIGCDLNCHCGDLFGSALAQSAREEGDEGSYWGTGAVLP
jgi:hypothetical protein